MMEESRPPGGGERRQLLHTVSAPQALRAGSAAPGLPHARSATARLEGAPSLTPSDSGHGEKVRKPYTITKQRERWTDAEHALFLEALREHGRAWRRIEEHIGTKTAVQIRSHAQKFFAKLEREQASGHKSTELPADLTIPPPRPKRKPARPYPKKSEPEASGTGLTGAGNHGHNHYPSATDRATNGSGSAGLQRHGVNHGSQHLTCSVASPANRPAPSPSPGAHSLGTQDFMGGVGGGPMAPYMQHGGPVWAHHGMHHGGVDVGVAAVAAAASAAAAAAAAAVVATADEATQAQLQADPPQGFPFFGMPPSALAHFAGQMQASPQLAGLAAVQQRAQLLQAQRQQQHLPHHGGGGHHAVKRPHARSPPAAHHPPVWGAGARGPSPVPSGAMEWTATSDPSGQHPEQLRVPSQPGSENDGDSACSRETRSGPAAVGARGGLANVQLRTGSGTNLLAGSGAAAAAAAASAADAARTLQLARAATFGPSTMPGAAAFGAAAGFGIAGANPRAASVPPQWAHLPIAALLQAAAVSGGLPGEGQGQAAQPQPPSPPMTHAQLFKPPFKPSSPDTSTRRAERAGKLRARRGGPVAASDAATNGGSGTGGASGQASYDNFNLPPQQADSGGRGKGAGAQGDGAAAAGDNAKADQRSSTPPSGEAGSDGSQDSMLVKNGFGDGDSDKAEGYGSNPTGNGSSDGLGNSNGSGNGNGSSDGADDARKPSPPAPSGDGTSKAPGKLMPGDRAPDPEQCAGKAHAHAHAQAHPHAHTPGGNQQASFQLAALQGLTTAAGMMPPSSAAVAAASANMSGWGPNLQGLGTQQATASSLLMAAAGQGLNATGPSPAALAALQAANSPAWSAVAAQMRRAGSAGGVPGLGPLFPGGHAVAAQQQAMLEQLQVQRQASAQYQHPIDGPHPQPGQAKAHSAFEPASQLTPPPSFRKPGPAKPTASGRSSGSDGARTPKDRSSGGGGHVGGSPRDGGAANIGDQALLERMPSRPRASRASPTGPPLSIAAAASPAAAGKGDGGGIVPLAGKDRDLAGGSGASGRSSNASAASGFQPYRAESGSLQKRTISGTRLDVPPRKRLHLCNVDQVSTVN